MVNVRTSLKNILEFFNHIQLFEPYGVVGRFHDVYISVENYIFGFEIFKLPIAASATYESMYQMLSILRNFNSQYNVLINIFILFN
jgi:hypothetical protein